MNKEFVYLGYVNGWKTTPDIVEKCAHQRKREEVRRCVTRITCEECKYVYMVDSTD